MKAAVIYAHGGPEQLVLADVPDAAPGPGEALIKVCAASINGADVKVRRGEGRYPINFPHILGRDFSGVVCGLGPGAAGVALGDLVFGVCPQGREGAYAERLSAPTDVFVPKPSALSHGQAASLALTGLTALWSLEDCARLAPGETVLIQGGAGGVGSFAVQLAHHLGAVVVATASAENHDYVRGLGADIVIDYRRVDFVRATPPCDVVFDTVGGEVQTRSYRVLKSGGRLVHIAAGPVGGPPPRRDVTVLRPDVGRDRAHLARIVRLVDEGAVRPPHIESFQLGEAALAHRVSEGRHLRGKLVLDMNAGQPPGFNPPP
jgi:NADPH:quinone reductase-like Zn-dependent oxidoreductase